MESRGRSPDHRQWISFTWAPCCAALAAVRHTSLSRKPWFHLIWKPLWVLGDFSAFCWRWLNLLSSCLFHSSMWQSLQSISWLFQAGCTLTGKILSFTNQERLQTAKSSGCAPVQPEKVEVREERQKRRSVRAIYLRAVHCPQPGKKKTGTYGFTSNTWSSLFCQLPWDKPGDIRAAHSLLCVQMEVPVLQLWAVGHPAGFGGALAWISRWLHTIGTCHMSMMFRVAKCSFV